MAYRDVVGPYEVWSSSRRFDKLDVMFAASVHLALIAEALRPQLA